LASIFNLERERLIIEQLEFEITGLETWELSRETPQ